MQLMLISFAGHAYIALRLARGLGAWPVWQALLVVLLAASAVLVWLGMSLRRAEASRGTDRLKFAGMLAMGWFSSMFVLTVLRDVGLLVCWLVSLGDVAVPIDAIAAGSAVAVFALATLASLVGYRNARAVPAVADVVVPIAGLPAALEGLRIVQITDLHVGPTIKRPQMQAIVDVVNRLDADIVAITGDLVDGSVAALAGDVAPLGTLRSRYGSFFVTGNHEYYSGAAAWVAQVRSIGIRVLMNEHVVLDRGGASVVLAGVTDYGAQHFDAAERSDPVRAMAGAPADAGLRILLAHQPRSATAAVAAGFDLQLSGHTHGGQFIPWNLFVPLQQPWVAGLVALGRMQVYVSRGSGYWGPPMRLGAPSEITCIRLVASTSSATRPMPSADSSVATTVGAAA
ncbi:metallophosphoesterase [soil metagenome]